MNNFEMHVTDSPSSSIWKQNFSTSRAELEAINTEKCRKRSFESLDSNSRNFWPCKKCSNQQLQYYQYFHLIFMKQWLLTIFTNWSSAYFVLRYSVKRTTSALYIASICNKPLPPPFLITYSSPSPTFG